MSTSDRKKIELIVSKIDNKEPDVITWKEFLKFLDKEAMKREKINDAHLYGRSVKRLQGLYRHSLREDKN